MEEQQRKKNEAKQREIGEIIAGERFPPQVGVDEAQAAEASTAAADTAEVGQHDLRGIADHHVLDRTTPIDEHTDLAVQLRRLRGELCGKLGGHHIRGRNASAIQALERLDLTCLESLGIARYLIAHARAIYPLQRRVPQI